MNINNVTGALSFDNKLTINSFITKKEIMGLEDICWEAWPSKGDETVSYRAVFEMEKNRQGDIYLIINFIRPGDMDATIVSWRFAPEKLLMGEQRKTEGGMTKKLREWFKEKTNSILPICGEWGGIDAAYDPHNRTCTIFCNYRSSFRDEKSWGDYCKWNNIKI
ncbi:hypothetical protein EXT68_22630 [Pectobacterium parmentieri]|uniref:Uncharacterized protein n=1 Tax=Pectobacterium parmentieri TaxID=1905730 RepID=A0A0H3I3B2_PECPM|nr:hypothetical protein [Pectobacterium parmentieri]AFI88285.1 Hypothetical protein W5S_0146 [Pectobacterium parmentieri]MBI0473385.1 hypothetical protein [Pectobacterium parmentieri]MBI0496010.1 hypothetical protein [Pectobacterium parmentieri]MBI0557414.1 hypothetical protein [Pectobacterium parmentieri]MBI0570552.1 hypothetical protein [Pectobacterium parmentieri]